MKKLLILLLFSGCVDDIVAQCKSAALQAETKAWSQCTDYYQKDVLPVLKAEVDQAQKNIVDQVTVLTNKQFIDAGCVRNQDFGWDCSQSSFCTPSYCNSACHLACLCP